MSQEPAPSERIPDAEAITMPDDALAGALDAFGEDTGGSHAAPVFAVEDLHVHKDDLEAITAANGAHDTKATDAAIRVLQAALDGRTTEDVPPVGQDTGFREWVAFLRPVFVYFATYGHGHPQCQDGILARNVTKLAALVKERRKQWKEMEGKAKAEAARVAKAVREEAEAQANELKAAGAAFESEDEGDGNDNEEKVDNESNDEVDEEAARLRGLETRIREAEPRSARPAGKAGKAAKAVKASKPSMADVDLTLMASKCDRCKKHNLRCTSQATLTSRRTTACLECRGAKGRCKQNGRLQPESTPDGSDADTYEPDPVVVKAEKTEKTSSSQRGTRQKAGTSSRTIRAVSTETEKESVPDVGLKRKAKAAGPSAPAKRAKVFDGVVMPAMSDRTKAVARLAKAQEEYSARLTDLREREIDVTEAHDAREQAAFLAETALAEFVQAAKSFS